jgi:hypothetical protein
MSCVQVIVGNMPWRFSSYMAYCDNGAAQDEMPLYLFDKVRRQQQQQQQQQQQKCSRRSISRADHPNAVVKWRVLFLHDKAHVASKPHKELAQWCSSAASWRW